MSLALDLAHGLPCLKEDIIDAPNVVQSRPLGVEHLTLDLELLPVGRESPTGKLVAQENQECDEHKQKEEKQDRK
ncbi:MAG: hypothetical protein M3R63_20675 [Actinomycetota bacterium]|nr:hypothetical protein [Actinomycetota bacterium]